MSTYIDNSIPVVLTDLQGKALKTFSSGLDCAKHLLLRNNSNVYACLSGKVMSIRKKYMVFYEDYYNSNTVLTLAQRKLKRKGLRGDVKTSKKRNEVVQ